LSAGVPRVPPSGEQFELTFGEQNVVVVGVGGGLRSYRTGRLGLLDGYGADEMSSSGRGQVLVPWPNRVQDGSYEFEGKSHQLALTEPENGNAIHGLVRWAAWSAAEREPGRVVIEHLLNPQPGYPFSLELSIEYALSENGLSVRTTATNVGSSACPFGSGAHPYLSVGTETIDDVALHVPAQTVLQMDERGLPVGSQPVEGTEYDFRAPRPIGATKLDNAFTGLERGDDGLARVTLTAPAGDRVTLWMDERHSHVMVYSGDTRPDVNRRSLAVEPMTCPPNAFRTGDDLVRLEPGASWTGAWGLQPAAADR
jgi:aldose 1-epimerase